MDGVGGSVLLRRVTGSCMDFCGLVFGVVDDFLGVCDVFWLTNWRWMSQVASDQLLGANGAEMLSSCA